MTLQLEKDRSLAAPVGTEWLHDRGGAVLGSDGIWDAIPTPSIPWRCFDHAKP